MSKIRFARVPYYDNFQVAKNYLKVLFQPKRSIQIRELNQIQSIFNNQIEQFADHIFKFGSRVDAGSVRLETDIEYVKMQATDVDGGTTDISKFDGKKVKGLFSEVEGIVKVVSAADDVDPDTLFIQYTGAGLLGTKIRLQEGEPVEVQDIGSYTVKVVDADATGRSSVFTVSESTYYVYGTFVNCPQQSIILDKYSTEPTYKVGLLVNQALLDYRDEASLRDNAIGTANYGAPGADRYRIELILIRKPIDSANDEQFVELAKVQAGRLIDVKNRPQYADITDMLARRTYDESGDYTVEPFYLEIEKDDDKFLARISDGKAYVKGYEIEKVEPSFIQLDPANGTGSVTNTSVRVDYGNKMYVISYSGGPSFDPHLLPFTEFDIQPYGQGDSNGTMFIKSWEFIYDDAGDEYYLMNFFDTNFTFNYTNDDPLNALYDVDKENMMLIPLSHENVVSIDGDINIIDNTEAAVTLSYKTKTRATGTYSFTLVGGVEYLDVPDVYEIESVMLGAVDVTDKFTLVQNAKDNYYEYSYIELNDGEAPLAGTVDVSYKYWAHGNVSGNCFAVGSYVDTAYDDYPIHVTKNGKEYNLRDVLDFRPVKDPAGNFTELGEYPLQGTDITIDALTVYQDRQDIVALDTSGIFHHLKGTVDKFPAIPDTMMPLYKLSMRANTVDPVLDIDQRYVENKRYTMRDIGDLEAQIEAMEEYVTLNLLEKSLETMTVTDSAGNNRYKNGFLTDNFSDLQAAASYSKDYQCGIDQEEQELRPSFKKRDIKLQVLEDKSSHYQITGDLMTLPYTDVEWHVQPYTSKTISVNPYFIYSQQGSMTLDPANDVWTDTVTEPAVQASIDTGVQALRQVASAVGVTGTFWGAPRTVETVLDSQFSSSQSSRTRNRRSTDQGISGGTFTISRTTTATTTVTTTRRRTDKISATTTTQGMKREVEAETTKHSLGAKVKDFQLLTYTRSTDVNVYASNLRKDLKHYFFFDGVDVTEDVRPLNGAFGEDVYANESGQVSAVFRIPNRPEKRFYVGTKVLRITNTSDNSKDPDELLSFAECQYHSGGLKQTKSDTILSVTAPAFENVSVEKQSTREFNRTAVVGQSSTSSSRVVGVERQSMPLVSVQPPRPVRTRLADPVAQSFFVQEPDGVFLTKIDTYFSAVGTEHPVWLEVREMDNGYPGKRIMPFGRLTKTDAEIVVDGVTTWVLEAPIYLSGNVEYCFVIGSDDPDHRIYISKLGETDEEAGVIISDQPHMGSMFKGQNNSTWNASQYEDIKFTLYKAEFDISSDMIGAFTRNDFNTKEVMPTNPIETTLDSEEIRIHHLSHGLSVGDKIKLDLLGDNEFDILIDSGNIVEGMTITGASGSFVVNKLTYVGIDELTSKIKYTFSPSNLIGSFSDNESVSGGPYIETVSVKGEVEGVMNTTTNVSLTATLPTGIDNTFNGVPLAELSKKSHTVTRVDSLDSFMFDITVPATASGRVGGDGNYMMPNIVMEGMVLKTAVLDFVGTGNWYYDSVRHAGIGSSLQDDLATTGNVIEPNEFAELDLPVKLNTTLVDANKYQEGRRSFVTYGTYESDAVDLSPAINIASIGMSCYGNRIENNDSTIDGQWVSETDALGFGTEKAKYVTNIVKLEDPAEDIKVWMDVLNNEKSEIQLWYRTLDEQSYESILDNDWVQVTGIEWPESEEEFIEVEFDLTPVPGTTIDPFKEFQVKIVMKTQNSAKVPRIKRFRCLALT